MSAKYEQELSWNFPTLSQVLQQNDKMITSTGIKSYKKVFGVKITFCCFHLACS